MTFDVLGTMRAIRNDERLTSTQLALLMCAVLRTDNATGHVRYSIELLAQDANVSYRTAKTVFQDEEVLGYFKKVVRTRRTVDFWFPLSPEGATVALSGGNPVHRGGNSCTPSTSSSTRTTSTTTVADAPVEKDGLEVREDSQPSSNYEDVPPDSPNVGSRDAAGEWACGFHGHTQSHQRHHMDRDRTYGMLAAKACWLRGENKTKEKAQWQESK